jgi:ribosomal protein S18 acetylase RimI-like enzyme
MKILKYNESDILQLMELIKELKAFEGQYDEDYLTGDESNNLLIEEITKPVNSGYGEIFVAEEMGQIIGFISFNTDIKNMEGIFAKVQVVYVSDIVVQKYHRGKGVGKLLLAEAENYARLKGIKYLKLVLFDKNISAKKFYESNGFENYEVTMLKEL